MNGAAAAVSDFNVTRKMAGADGLVYRLSTARSAHRVLLLHPLAMWGGLWASTVEAMGGHASVVAPDLRGHGQSPKSSLPCSPEQHVADLVALLDELGWEDAVVAGASMGGCVALALAAAAPSRVSGLGLIDTTAWYGEGAPARWASRGDQAVTDGMASLLEFQLSRWFSEGFRASAHPVIRTATDVFVGNDVPSYRQACLMLGSFDARSVLPGIAAPTAVIVGEHDYATPPEMARELAATIPDAELHVLADLRHFTPLEAPEQIAQLLLDLCGRARAL